MSSTPGGNGIGEVESASKSVWRSTESAVRPSDRAASLAHAGVASAAMTRAQLAGAASARQRESGAAEKPQNWRENVWCEREERRGRPTKFP